MSGSTAWREGETERGLPRSAATKQLNQGKASRASLRVVLARRGVLGRARTDELFGVKGMHVLDVTRDSDAGGGQGLVVLDGESDAATSPAAGRKTAE